MELALAAIALSVVVLILQIVTISKVTGLKKALGELADRRPPQQHQFQDRDRQRRDQDFRRNRGGRPMPDTRNRPQTTAAPVAGNAGNGGNDAVESSLRDINLRLKNAERDQDLARRRLQEGNLGSNDQRDRGRRDDRRGGRDRGRDHRRDRDRRPNGGNWQDRGRRDFSRNQGGPTGNEVESPQGFDPTIGREQESPQTDIRPQNVESTAPVTEQNAPEMAVSDFAPENQIEHGRRVQIKRRHLQDGGEAQVGLVETASGESPQTNTQESQEGSAAGDERPAEIHFGRR